LKRTALRGLYDYKQGKSPEDMTKTQKRLLAAAAIAGLVGGAVAKGKMISDTQIQAMAGKQTSSFDRNLNGCNGCGGKGGCSSKTNSPGKS
jgi:hypothetical protein